MAVTTKTAAEVRAEIEAHAAKANVPEARDGRVAEIAGDVIRQGDVYLVMVPSDWPKGEPRGERQVAVGTTTGSRHVAEGPAVRLFEPKDRSATIRRLAKLGHKSSVALREYQIGPVVESPEPWALTHPEHAHVACPAGSWQVTYQRDPQTDRVVAD